MNIFFYLILFEIVSDSIFDDLLLIRQQQINLAIEHMNIGKKNQENM